MSVVYRLLVISRLIAARCPASDCRWCSPLAVALQPGASGIVEQGVRQARRERQRAGAKALIKRLRVGAVNMRGLIPSKVEVKFAGLRRDHFIMLIIVADVIGPYVRNRKVRLLC